ncbi:MAG: response regulator, partial [Victivallaceae bacterium]|nr:response regulator [Victivallaceae bacterium]
MQNSITGLKTPDLLKKDKKKHSSDKEERILIVDDTPATLELLERNLSPVGYRILKASNVDEALRVIDRFPVDLVITDIKMPGLSGVHLARHIRENHHDMAVMIITAYPSVKGAVEAVKTGAEEYLAKPFTSEELLSAVTRTLRNLYVRRTARASGKQRIHIPHGLIG